MHGALNSQACHCVQLLNQSLWAWSSLPRPTQGMVSTGQVPQFCFSRPEDEEPLTLRAPPVMTNVSIASAVNRRCQKVIWKQISQDGFRRQSPGLLTWGWQTAGIPAWACPSRWAAITYNCPGELVMAGRGQRDRWESDSVTMFPASPM